MREAGKKVWPCGKERKETDIPKILDGSAAGRRAPLTACGTNPLADKRTETGRKENQENMEEERNSTGIRRYRKMWERKTRRRRRRIRRTRRPRKIRSKRKRNGIGREIEGRGKGRGGKDRGLEGRRGRRSWR